MPAQQQKGFETISSSCRADMLRQLADVHWLAGAAAEARRFYSLHSTANALMTSDASICNHALALACLRAADMHLALAQFASSPAHAYTTSDKDNTA